MGTFMGTLVLWARWFDGHAGLMGTLV